jgi:hypothetical protein
MRFIKSLSLEVVLGAVLYQVFFFEVYFHSIPSYSEVLLLALVVWLLYLGDRQLDNVFLPIQDERHRVHGEKRKVMRCLIGAVGLLILCLLPFQALEVLLAGFTLFFFVVVYGFAWHRGWLRAEKELVTAVLYSLGVGLVVWVREPRAFLLVLTLLFLAYQNLCYFALIENSSDFYAGRLKKTEWILVGLFSGMYVATQDLFIVLPFLATFGITFLLSRTALSEGKRLWGDVAFWSPLIYLLHGIFST